MRPTYDVPGPVDRAVLARLLDSGPAADLEPMLVAVALNDPDLDYAYATLLYAARSRDPLVRGVAIRCLGHLARIHRTLPDDRAIELVRAGMRDRDPQIVDHAESTASDLRMYVPSIGRRI